MACILFVLSSCGSRQVNHYDVIVVGDGTGAITAAVQAARSGAKTILVNELEWLGGMLTSAGVSAIDGNHELPAGIWDEFRDSIYKHYGGPTKVATGWVSNTHFEPHIGNRIFQNMAKQEPNLYTRRYKSINNLSHTGTMWQLDFTSAAGPEIKISSKILIDGTDLGDIAAMAGASFDIGMEKKEDVDELLGTENNNIIQDMTYVAILEKSSAIHNSPIPKSENYDPNKFYCACEKLCPHDNKDLHPCDVMMNYAKLPNDKYLINWPIQGNDIYLNIIERNKEERDSMLIQAKEKTLDFVHFIQEELGYSGLALSTSEFPTKDYLPLMPYHREGRRIHGKIRFTSNHIKNPSQNNLYKTGIAVGNYPIDHHHKERQDIPEMEFPSVPAYALPLGALIPKEIENLVVADKAISVSNIANGTTRLQPVIMQVGQAAGIIAAEAIAKNINSSQVNVRQIQDKVLEAGGYISPFKDLNKENQFFKAAQRVAACGLIELERKPFKWANESLLNPNAHMTQEEALNLIQDYTGKNIKGFSSKVALDYEQLLALLHMTGVKNVRIEDLVTDVRDSFQDLSLTESTNVTRLSYIYLIDKYLDAFHQKDINLKGEWIAK